MRWRRRIVAVVAAGLAVLSVAACSPAFSDDNGIATASGPDAVAAVREAVRDAGSFQLSGTLTPQVTIDVSVADSKTATGTISYRGSTVSAVFSDGSLLVHGDAQFWNQLLGELLSGSVKAGAAATLSAGWVKIPADKLPAALGRLTEVVQAFGQLDTVSVGDRSTIDGLPVVSLTSSTGVIVWVRTTGAPYPVELTAGSDIALQASRWGQKVEVDVPTATLDLTAIVGQ